MRGTHLGREVKARFLASDSRESVILSIDSHSHLDGWAASPGTLGLAASEVEREARELHSMGDPGGFVLPVRV